MAVLLLGGGLASFAFPSSAFSYQSSNAERRFGLTAFHSVEIQTDAVVEIVPTSPISAVASGPRDKLDRLHVEARDGRLRVESRKFAGDDRRKNSSGPLRITIHAPLVQHISVVGGGDVRVQQMRGQRLSVALRGPGRLGVDGIKGDRLTVQMLGNGSMALSGEVKQMQAHLSGDNRLAAKDLRADDLNLVAEGVGDHHLHAVKRAAITARGVGRVQVDGRPSCNVQNMSGGSVQCGSHTR